MQLLGLDIQARRGVGEGWRWHLGIQGGSQCVLLFLLKWRVLVTTVRRATAAREWYEDQVAANRARQERQRKELKKR